jgi:hypothetical protein
MTDVVSHSDYHLALELSKENGASQRMAARNLKHTHMKKRGGKKSRTDTSKQSLYSLFAKNSRKK